MSLPTTPAEIASLATIIHGTDAWETAIDDDDDMDPPDRIFSDKAVPADIETNGPTAILSLLGNRQAQVLLLGGADMDDDDVHALAQDLAFQIQSRYRSDMTGLHIPKEPTVGEVGDPTEAMKTAGDGRDAVLITIPYGISTD